MRRYIARSLARQNSNWRQRCGRASADRRRRANGRADGVVATDWHAERAVDSARLRRASCWLGPSLCLEGCRCSCPLFAWKEWDDGGAHSPPKGETRHKFSLSNKKIVKAQNQYPNSKSGLNAPILMSDLCYKLLQAYFGGKFRSVVTSITTLCLYYSIVLSKLMRLFRA